ncbi:MAG: SDR family oxidoreductase [Acidimicrobiaceae bacterium]|nr:SDR family NAD(P)-dependent oxidoreductase [Acidimicrobiaceae bacterium]MDE0517169.1 SDR family NAD(P)-dependent oxidoreductase [Acidimicrobiaceae bacterium]MDE0656869.1 SDR family NAD(P)-dependent oxidoreductase [Acidimicrobiaceae bacterium]MXZ97304.1 SDR family oxidoreductase [Acidimicrobiaceae bacterium]MYF44507.1 SDR family oxidoreductase [Acidimicrobiaceae bacterium]
MTAIESAVAVVTGGGSGIGSACAASLSARGTRCVLVGRRRDRLEAAASELDGPATPIAADLTAPGEPERVVAEVLAEHGRIDLMVHSAGVFDKAPASEVTRDHWQRVLDVNLSAVMALTRAGWEALSESGGQIVLISSIAAVQAFEGNAAYAASKGGLNALGEVLRLEGRDRGIRVITLSPAQIDTELWDGKAPDAVRARMMPATGVGELVASLVHADRRIDIGPIVIRPVHDPWVGPAP